MEAPQVQCPRCKRSQDDHDGFGVLKCEHCDFCTHPAITEGVCQLCGHVDALDAPKAFEGPKVTADTKLLKWPDAPPIEVYVHNNMSYQLAYQSLRADAAMARLRVAVDGIKAHNDACVKSCGEGDQEGVACGYRPYFPRHCPGCPLYDLITDGNDVRLEVTIGPLPPLPALPKEAGE